jgi:hypothetical protein
MAGSGAELVGGGACGWGSGMPAPSGQIPPPWAWWENEASRHESCLQLVSGSARQALDPVQGAAFGTRWAGRWNSAPEGLWGQDDSADVGEALAQVVVLKALVGGPHVHPQPVGALVGRFGPAPVRQLGAQPGSSGVASSTAPNGDQATST